MSLDTRIADKQHIHTLTTRPGSQCGASAPTDAADDAATDPGSHHISIQLHAKRRRPGLDNILTPACVRASLSPRPADTTPAAGSKSHDACRAMSQATLAYGPVNEAEGRVARSNGVDGGVVDNAIYVDGVRTANPATLDETYERMRERHGMAWIGLYRPTPEEIRSVGTEFGLHHLVVDDAIAAHQRPKLERYGDILFTVLRPARYIDQREQVEFGELHVVTGDGFVVTIRYAESPDLASVRRRLESQPDLLRLGPEAVLYSIMDQVVDEYAPVVAGLENDIDEIEDQLFNNDPAVSRRIYTLTREVLRSSGRPSRCSTSSTRLLAGSISTTSTSSCTVTSATSATTSCGSSSASTPSALCCRTRSLSTPPWSVSAKTMRSNG
jgi:hypothetical protein